MPELQKSDPSTSLVESVLDAGTPLLSQVVEVLEQTLNSLASLSAMAAAIESVVSVSFHLLHSS